MHMLQLVHLRPGGRRPPRVRGFTLVEVMAAATVLVLAIVSSLLVLQRGFQAVDSARALTAAGELMQAEIESLRLKNWSQLEDLQDQGDETVIRHATANGTGVSFRCTRQIRDVKTGMKEIVLAAEWLGQDGRPQSARLITRYGRSGLNDYFYTVH
jgi:type II secretory pathway pseudopilin PulG